MRETNSFFELLQQVQEEKTLVLDALKQDEDGK